jgi:multiple sugar transport system permease protein
METEKLTNTILSRLVRTGSILKSQKVSERIFKIIVSIIMWVIAIYMVLPFIWMVSSSFKDSISMFRYPIEWIPRKWNFINYIALWRRTIPFGEFYKNSINVVIIALIGTFFSCSMAAFGYSKINFPGRDKLFLLKLSTTMIPVQVTMLPTFVIYRALGMLDTHAALWLPSFLGGTFGVFLMRQYMTTIPDELVEASKIDGCSYFRIYWQVVLPLSKPALASLLFLYFTWTWNDYEKALLYLRSVEKFTLPLALKYLADDQFVDYAGIMAAAVCTSLPIIALSLFTQKYFVRGIASTGIKG